MALDNPLMHGILRRRDIKGTQMTRTAVARKRGRPAIKPSERKRNNVTIRVRDALKSELQSAAAEFGRSLSEEMETRLERSLLEERAAHEELGGQHVYDMFRLLGAAARLIEARTGKRSSDDWETWYAVQKAWQKLIPALGPQQPTKKIRRLMKPGSNSTPRRQN